VDKFRRNKIEIRDTRREGSDFDWKPIGIDEIADDPPLDRKVLAEIEKITIAHTNHSADSWVETEILDNLSGQITSLLARRQTIMSQAPSGYILRLLMMLKA
jgi:hypothetical protein